MLSLRYGAFEIILVICPSCQLGQIIVRPHPILIDQKGETTLFGNPNLDINEDYKCTTFLSFAVRASSTLAERTRHPVCQTRWLLWFICNNSMTSNPSLYIACTSAIIPSITLAHYSLYIAIVKTLTD